MLALHVNAADLARRCCRDVAERAPIPTLAGRRRRLVQLCRPAVPRRRRGSGVRALLSLQARSALRGLLVIGGVGAGVTGEQTLKAIIGRTPETLAALPRRLVDGVRPFVPRPATSPARRRCSDDRGVLRGRTSRTVKAALGFGGARCAVRGVPGAVLPRAHLLDVLGGMFLGGALWPGVQRSLRVGRRCSRRARN